MSKDYDPVPTMLARLEEQNECLRFAVETGVKMRKAQDAYFRHKTKDNLIAAKVAEADFDKAAKAAMGGAA